MIAGPVPYVVCVAFVLGGCTSNAAAWMQASETPQPNDRVTGVAMAIELALSACEPGELLPPSDIAAYLQGGEWHVGWRFTYSGPEYEALVTAATGEVDGRCTVTITVG